MKKRGTSGPAERGNLSKGHLRTCPHNIPYPNARHFVHVRMPRTPLLSLCAHRTRWRRSHAKRAPPTQSIRLRCRMITAATHAASSSRHFLHSNIARQAHTNQKVSPPSTEPTRPSEAQAYVSYEAVTPHSRTSLSIGAAKSMRRGTAARQNIRYLPGN